MSRIICVVDTETTGTATYDKVIELGAFFFSELTSNSYEFVGHYHIYNTVDKIISVGAQQVHGITPKKLEELSEGKSYTYYLDDVYGLLSQVDVLIGHNIQFDISKIRMTYGNVFNSNMTAINTMDIVRPYVGKRCNIRALSTTARVVAGLEEGTFEKEFEEKYGKGGYHGALFDAYITARSYMLLNDIEWIYPNT